MAFRQFGLLRPLGASGVFRPKSSARLGYAGAVLTKNTCNSCRLDVLSRAGTSRPLSQIRLQSTSNHQPPNADEPPPRRPSIARGLLRIIRGSFANLFNVFRGQNLRALFRSNPEELVLALLILAACAGVVAYAASIYFTYFYSRQFTRYPPPIAKSLRRALYFSNYSPDPPRALKYYKLALEQCDEHGLDPFSDDVMGIKIQLAAWLEKIGNYNGSIKVLETLLGDCKKWVEVMEQSVKDGTASVKPALPPSQSEGNESSDAVSRQVAPQASLWAKRTRVLGKAVGISVKLGELYSDEHVLEQDIAHDRLTWAVETALKELQRRALDGVKEGEGQWMNSEAIGGALESLAHSYESKSQFHLAIPLFLQALRLSLHSCHNAVIMNNISTSFAQHPLDPRYQTLLNDVIDADLSSDKAATPVQMRTAYLDAARRWATNAYRHAKEPQGEARTPECDEACAVSLCNLGDIAALSGNKDEARRRFQQCIAMSKELGYEPGIKQAEAGLKLLR